MPAAAPFRRAVRAAVLTGLLGSVAPAALAQAIPTANTQSSGISQEQALALSARLDALEKRNEELEQQILDLKTASGANVQIVRDQVNAQPTVTLSNARPTIATADGNFKFAIRSLVQFDAAHYSESPRTAANDLGSGTNFRRARLGVEGTAWKDWNFGLWGEFGGSGGESTTLPGLSGIRRLEAFRAGGADPLPHRRLGHPVRPGRRHQQHRGAVPRTPGDRRTRAWLRHRRRTHRRGGYGPRAPLVRLGSPDRQGGRRA